VECKSAIEAQLHVLCFRCRAVSAVRRRHNRPWMPALSRSACRIARLQVSFYRVARIHGVKCRHRIYGHDTIAILWV